MRFVVGMVILSAPHTLNSSCDSLLLELGLVCQCQPLHCASEWSVSVLFQLFQKYSVVICYWMCVSQCPGTSASGTQVLAFFLPVDIWFSSDLGLVCFPVTSAFYGFKKVLDLPFIWLFICCENQSDALFSSLHSEQELKALV